MSAGTAEYGAEALDDLGEMVAAARGRWGLSPRAEIELLNISENATYRLSDPEEGCQIVLRLHRVGYHTVAEIKSELAWVDGLRQSQVIDTARPLPSQSGELVEILPSPGGHKPRCAVAFEFIPGREPDQDSDLVGWFSRLGKITATMHDHARRWKRPDGFVRKVWDYDAMIGSRPYWGRWRDGLGLDAAGTNLIGRAAELIRRRVAAFGTDPDRFGLIHADLRLANLLVDGDRLNIIDFDDCGFSWYLYDFASAISFFEHEPIVPALLDSWVEGYRSIASLSEQDLAEMPIFIMARRILLVAWIASHAETPTAQAMGVPYTEQSLHMAEALLSRFG